MFVLFLGFSILLLCKPIFINQLHCSTANRQIVAGATGQMIDDLPPSLRHIHCATVISFQSDSDQD